LTGTTKIDELGLRQYKKLRTFFNGRTMYSDIKMFPAGHYFLNGKVLKYWELKIDDKDPPSDEELRFLIESAVSYRCISDVPVGSYLSGGLDSTIVAGLASKPHTWTVGFLDNNEFYWGRVAANKFHSDHHEIVIKKDEYLPLAAYMIKKRMEPLSVPNEVLLYKMTKAVKEFNTVVLSGEGADELLFGYDRLFRWAAESAWDLEKFSTLYSYGSCTDLEVVEDVISPFYKYGKTINIVAAFFQVAHLHGLLRRLDNATMLCAVEARTPFVDYRLVERLAGVPFEYKVSNGIVKSPLKRVFQDLVPTQIIDRPKVGFPVNLNDIFGLKKTDKSGMDKWFEFNLSNL
jgi:Asparagine synthase (glutamine-hydrolyzing)